MKTKKVPSQDSQQSADPSVLADRAISQPELVPQLLQTLNADEPRVKYGGAKALRIASEKAPEVLYPHLDFFAALLKSDNTILHWNAILILGNLASADCNGKLDDLLTQYLKPIRDPVMITAANTIRGAARIAVAKPALADRIARHILKVEKAKYQTAECQNIACGHAIAALDECFEQINRKRAVIEFVRRQLANSRNATRKKAMAFLKKHSIG